MEQTTTILCLCPDCGRMYWIIVLGEVDDLDTWEMSCPSCVEW